MGERFLKSIRLLADCLQSYERLSGQYVRQSGLTHAQFDIIATLGNTPGMSYKELGDKTLITKGTLTGVIDRLELRGIVKRAQSRSDGRSTIVRLTRKGEDEFTRIFPLHLAHLRVPFAALSEEEMDQFDALAGKLRAAFASASRDEP